MTRFARPCGAVRSLRLRPVQLAAPVVDPRSGVLIPPGGMQYAKKKLVLSYELFFKYGGEGGIDSLRSPLRGSPLTAFAVCPTGCASCRPPVGGSHPPLAGCNMRKKSSYFRTSSSLNMAVRGGFEPPIRCRIHTFQACSFSHSDTSPYCFAAHLGWATGRYYRELR